MVLNRSLAALCFGLALIVPAMAGDVETCNDETGPVALAACERAIATGQYKGLELSKLLTNRGAERKRKGDVDGAIADYGAALDLNPSDQFAWNNRANARRDKGDIEGAFADYAAALKLDPGYTAVYINRGLLYERMKNVDAARSDFEEAIVRPPKYQNGAGGQQIARQRLQALGAAPK